MLTLSNGFKKPEDGDKGSIFFPALEENIQQMNDHTHDGTNSAQLSSTAFNHNFTNILAANWVAVVGKTGLYRQLVTMPVGLSLGNIGISFIDSSGDFYLPTVEQVSSSSYYVYLNDNTITLKAIYV